MSMSHAQAVNELRENLAPIFDRSPDGVYVWLDETNKACNDKLAKLFGYSVDEWEAVDDFAATFLADDRGHYVWEYQTKVADLRFPVTFRFKGKRKDGSTFDAETDMIPLTYGGHTVAYHFVRQVGA
ncbi:MAG: PAS domain S-box protein [Actinomycetota bacterium]